jgi:gamma-glutamylcyclotransferase (GGCT)/AIG2-like uncharacterized protein YtfP
VTVAGIGLFVYGTLMSEPLLYSLTGRRFPRRRATLEGYERILPNQGYPYVVPKSGGQVEGFLVEEVDDDSLRTLDAYEDEGRLYLRRPVEVNVDGSRAACDTYVGNVEALRAQFGVEVEVDRRVRAFLEARVHSLLSDLADGGAVLADPRVRTRARAELLGEQIGELVETHFRFPPLFRALAERQLRRTNLPTLARVKADPTLRRYAEHYLRLAVRHIIFNQLEEMIRRDYYGAVWVPDPFYERTISCLVALTFLNRNRLVVRELMRTVGADRLQDAWDYIDYAVHGVLIADKLYDPPTVEKLLHRIRDHRQVSVTPLGAECEFSRLGAAAVSDPGGEDPEYDGFRYFPDFYLLRRTWKLGGHVDDHRVHEDPRERRRGFLEYAFGRVSLLGHLSKPVTNDPWILNQLVNQAALFVEVPPHSLHLTFDVARPIRTTGANEVPHLLVMLLLGGDFRERPDGSVHEARVGSGEIVDAEGHLYFFEENRHVAEEPAEDIAGRSEPAYRPVVEYKFPRLRLNHDFEPLVVALKGYHIAQNPRVFSSDFRVLDEPAIADEAAALRAWAVRPTALAAHDIADFVAAVEAGLTVEDHGHLGHTGAYVDRMVASISRLLTARNAWLRAHGPRR